MQLLLQLLALLLKLTKAAAVASKSCLLAVQQS
jgi:hypothetical protein